MLPTRSAIIPSLRIAFDPAQTRRAGEELASVKNGLPRAINGAINRLLPKVRTQTTRELADLVTAKPNNIRNRIFTRKSTVATLAGSVNIQRRQIALINFKHKERRRKKGWGTAKSGTGVEVQIYKNGPTQKFPHAFIATGRRDQKQADGTLKGNKHIFERVRNAAGKRAPRGPLVSLRGISLMTEFERRADMRARVQRYIERQTPIELDSQVDRFLKRPKTHRP